MCGFYVSNLTLDVDSLKNKLNLMAHRGPDSSNSLCFDGINFGHVRLSVLDLDNRSNQPFIFDNYVIVYNGEVYNYLDIKKELVDLGHIFITESDTEVILYSYLEWGSKALDKFNGMFAFCIYNRLDKTLFGARDRLGVKPFYYYFLDGVFEISSQVNLFNNKFEICEEAISYYYDLGYIPSPLSIYKNIKKLEPGCFFNFDLNTNFFSIEKYWDISEIREIKISYEDAKSELHNLIVDSINLRLQSDVPIGFFLSGGIDSALIASISKKLNKTDVNTFTIGFYESHFDESSIAANYSKLLNTKHNIRFFNRNEINSLISNAFRYYDEPFADSSALPSLLLAKTVKEKVSVALSGDGGDESFFGYNQFRWVIFFNVFLFFKLGLLFGLILEIPFWKWVISDKRLHILKKISQIKSVSKFIEHIYFGFDSLCDFESDNRLKYHSKYFKLSNSYLRNISDFNLKFWLENDSNVKVDRASMAFSLEVRSPFLDFRIIEFCRSLPLKYTFSFFNRKAILKHILSEYLPKKSFQNRKKGFSIPIADLLRNEIKNDVLNSLSPSFLKSLPNFNEEKFSKMLESHMSKNSNYGPQIWRIYILSKWFEINNKY